MARARLLKPGFFSNEELCELPPFGRLLFAGLWTIADREGRLDDRPKRIKAEIFPYDNVPVPGLLDKLEEKGFIQRYCIEGAHFIQITTFEKHQHPHKNEAPSIIPAPFPSDVVGTELPEASSNGDEDSSNYASPSSNGGTTPAVPIPVPNSESVPIAETVTAASPDAPAEHPFAFMYASNYQRRNHGRPPPPTEHAAALALEREYGADACIEAAGDYDWAKHPNYLRPILQERRDGKARQPTQPTGSARGVQAEASPSPFAFLST